MVVWFLRTEPLIFNCFCNKHLREQFKIFIDCCQWSERNINDSANSFKTNKEQTSAKSLRKKKKKIKWDEKLLVSSANISWEYFHFRRRISKRYCCAQTNTHWFRDWTAKHEYYWEDAGKKIAMMRSKICSHSKYLTNGYRFLILPWRPVVEKMIRWSHRVKLLRD